MCFEADSLTMREKYFKDDPLNELNSVCMAHIQKSQYASWGFTRQQHPLPLTLD